MSLPKLITFEVSLPPSAAATLRESAAALREAGQTDVAIEKIAAALILEGLNKPRHWTCDNCGLLIKRPQDGLLAWVWHSRRAYARDLRIIHHASASPPASVGRGLKLIKRDTSKDVDACANLTLTPGEEVYEVPLHHLTDADGLMQLLERISEGHLPQRKLLEMLMRIHLPNYERARPDIENAIKNSVIRPNMSSGFYWQGELIDVIKWVQRQRLIQSGDSE